MINLENVTKKELMNYAELAVNQSSRVDEETGYTIVDRIALNALTDFILWLSVNSDVEVPEDVVFEDFYFELLEKSEFDIENSDQMDKYDFYLNCILDYTKNVEDRNQLLALKVQAQISNDLGLVVKAGASLGDSLGSLNIEELENTVNEQINELFAGLGNNK